MVGAIQPYFLGDTAPGNARERAMRPATPAAAGGGHCRAQHYRKRPGQLPPADGRLLSPPTHSYSSQRHPGVRTSIQSTAGGRGWMRVSNTAATMTGQPDRHQLMASPLGEGPLEPVRALR